MEKINKTYRLGEGLNSKDIRTEFLTILSDINEFVTENPDRVEMDCEDGKDFNLVYYVDNVVARLNLKSPNYESPVTIEVSGLEGEIKNFENELSQLTKLKIAHYRL